MINFFLFEGINQFYDRNGMPSDFPVSNEISIPLSSAFEIPGINKAIVARPADINNFLDDWSFMYQRLKPKIGFQDQLGCKMSYNRSTLEKSIKESQAIGIIATLDISVGTINNHSMT